MKCVKSHRGSGLVEPLRVPLGIGYEHPYPLEFLRPSCRRTGISDGGRLPDYCDARQFLKCTDVAPALISHIIVGGNSNTGSVWAC